MAQEYKEKEVFEKGFDSDVGAIEMQSILYEDCMRVRYQKQLLEDEELAKRLQEMFNSEMNPRPSIYFSESESDDEDVYYETDSRNSPRRNASTCTCYSNSFTSFSSSSGHPSTDSDDNLPMYASYEVHSSQDSDEEGDVYEINLDSLGLIDLLPTQIYNPSNDKSESPSDKKSCLICLLEWETGDCIKSLPCFHRFHSECIDKSLMSKSSCPVCRHEVH